MPTAAASVTPAPALRWYVRIVIVIGSAIVAQSVALLPDTPYPLQWSLLALCALVTGSFAVHVESLEATMSVSDTFFLTSTLLFGPAPATVALSVNGAVMSWRRGHSWERIVFNGVAGASSIWIAGHVFFLLARVQPLSQSHTPVGQLIVPLLALAIVYFLFNSGLTAVAAGLEARRSPVALWRQHFLWLSVGYLGAAPVSFCLILLIQQVSFAALIIVLPLLVVFHLTLRSSFGRLDDAHKHLKDMDRLYRSTVETLAMVIDAKDDVTHGHVRRVQAYAIGLAKSLGVTDEASLMAIDAAALLHDTGKLAVPERILNKPGGLTEAEFEKMKQHVDVGADILSLVQFPYPVVPIVRGHHENWDGSGYPRGLAGEEIPIGARILAVVDCFDALTSDRPYRLRMTDEPALSILRERRGRMYDPRVVDTFIEIYRDISVGTPDSPSARDVLQRITNAGHETIAPHEPVATPAAPGNLLAFVSLARVASGDGRIGDVLALASRLMADIVPDVTGAWFLPDGHDRLLVADAFGPSASILAGLTIGVGERLTGWVAANRQPVVNSDAALDLGSQGRAAVPALTRCLSVPLLSGDSLVGVLSLYASETGAFKDDQGRLIQMIAPHLAATIQGAHRPASESDGSARKPSDLRLVRPR